jgi:hypothetical protein
MTLTNEQKAALSRIRDESLGVTAEIGQLEVYYVGKKSELLDKYKASNGKMMQFINAVAMANGIDVDTYRFNMKTMSFEQNDEVNVSNLSVVK